MGVMSGKLGLLSAGATGTNSMSTMRNWKVSQTIESKTFVASNTNLGTGRRAGVVDWQGSCQQYSWLPIILPGDKGVFKGYEGPTSGVPGSAGMIISGAYICDNIQIALNWGGAELQQITTNFLSDGPLTRASGPQVPDDSTPSTVPSGEGKVELALASAPTVFSSFCTQQATFNLLTQMHPYSNSCGWDATAKAMTRKRESGAIDWNLALVSDDVTFFNANQYPVGTFCLVKLFVNATQYWALNYGIVDSYSDFTVDRETGALETFTMNIMMSVDKGSGNPTDGIIQLPGIVTPWWPVTGTLFNEERDALLMKMHNENLKQNKEVAA